MSDFNPNRVDDRRTLVFFYVVLFVLYLFLSYLVAFREFSIGKDSAQYAMVFYREASNIVINWGRFEPGFLLLMHCSSLILESHEFFFFIVFSIVFSFNYLAFANLLKLTDLCYKDKFLLLFLFLSFSLLSSWFYSAITNGLRQGIALSIFYYSVSLVSINKNKKGLIFYLLAVSFHYSAFLLAPILMYKKFNTKFLFFSFSFSALIYAVDGFKVLFSYLPSSISSTVFTLIQDVGGDRWVGFQLSFVIYTIFFGVIIYFSSLYSKVNKNLLDCCAGIYFMASLQYFILGFGPYSNRFAFSAWYFIPLIQVFVFCSLIKHDKFYLSLIYLMLVVSLIRFSYIFTNGTLF